MCNAYPFCAHACVEFGTKRKKTCYRQGNDESALVDFTTLRHIEYGTIVQLAHNHSCGVRFRLHGAPHSTCHYTVITGYIKWLLYICIYYAETYYIYVYI